MDIVEKKHSGINADKKHSVTIDGRRRGLLSGVSKVEGASITELRLVTPLGGLVIRGKDLKIISFSENSGELSFDGEIDSVFYDKVRTPLIKRLFK